MSANNILIIEQTDDLCFSAHDVSVEAEQDFRTDENTVFKAETEREAIEKAQAYMDENIVEYGYQFVFKK